MMVSELRAQLVFDDDLYPDKNSAAAQVVLRAEGAPVDAGGCAAAGGAGLPAGLLLLGLMALRRRR